MAKRLGWICRTIPLGLVGAAGALAIIRWTIQDRWLVTSVFYYVGQPVVIAVLLVAASLMCWRQRSRHWATAAGVAAACFAIIWCVQSFRFSSVAPPATAHRAVSWNVMSGRLGWRGIYKSLRDMDADVIILVEAYEDEQERATLLSRYLPDYQATAAHDGLMILSRGPLTRVDFGALGRGGHIVTATTTLGGRSLDVMAIDIESDPRRFRRLPLEALADRVASEAGRPLLVAGDFNTPPDSIYYAKLRATMRNGFETVGWGYGPTWPSIAPAVRLDQFWVNDGVTLYSCTGGWTVRSDHRPRILEFGF